MRKIRHGRAWLFLVCWTLLTGFILSYPFDKTPPIARQGFDKVVHASLFTVMGVAAQAAAPWVSVVITAPVAVGLELVQQRIPGKEYSIVDMLANLTGVVLGLVAFELSNRFAK